jgi:hypothetical protein
MSDTSKAPRGPAEQHEQLMTKVGDWQVACQYFLGGEAVEATGEEKVEALGAYWTNGQFRCDLMGKEIKGRATSGYDPIKGKYVSSWQDSVTPFFYYFEGELDEEGRLVMEGENYDPFSKAMTVYRSIETFAENERSLQLFIAPADTDPIQVLEYRYTRI